jgi:hypothetical protein
MRQGEEAVNFDATFGNQQRLLTPGISDRAPPPSETHCERLVAIGEGGFLKPPVYIVPGAFPGLSKSNPHLPERSCLWMNTPNGYNTGPHRRQTASDDRKGVRKSYKFSQLGRTRRPVSHCCLFNPLVRSTLKATMMRLTMTLPGWLLLTILYLILRAAPASEPTSL